MTEKSLAPGSMCSWSVCSVSVLRIEGIVKNVWATLASKQFLNYSVEKGVEQNVVSVVYSKRLKENL